MTELLKFENQVGILSTPAEACGKEELLGASGGLQQLGGSLWKKFKVQQIPCKVKLNFGLHGRDG